MFHSAESFTQVLLSGLSKLWPVALSFGDNIVLFCVTKLRLPVPGLTEIGHVLLVITIGYWLVHLALYYFSKRRATCASGSR